MVANQGVDPRYLSTGHTSIRSATRSSASRRSPCQPGGCDRRSTAAVARCATGGGGECGGGELRRFERRHTGLCQRHDDRIERSCGARAAPPRTSRSRPLRPARTRIPRLSPDGSRLPAHARRLHLGLRHRLRSSQPNHARRRQPDGGVAPRRGGDRVFVGCRRKPGSVGGRCGWRRRTPANHQAGRPGAR